VHRVHILPGAASATLSTSANSAAEAAIAPHLSVARSIVGSPSAAAASTPQAVAATKPAPEAPDTIPYTHTVHHDGNRYFATAEMAEIFRAHAEEIVRLGQTELVPLLHRSGVELLLISSQTNFAVVAIEVGHLKAS
jgi:hypothetical protein